MQIAAPKPDLGAKAKKYDFGALFQGILNGKSSAPKRRNIWCQSITRNLHAATKIRFTTLSCKRQYCSIMHSREKPLRNHSTAICRRWVAKHTGVTRNGSTNCSSKTGCRRQSEKRRFRSTFLKINFNRKIISAKIQKNLVPKRHSQPSCTATTMRFTTLSCKRQ